MLKNSVIELRHKLLDEYGVPTLIQNPRVILTVHDEIIVEAPLRFYHSSRLRQLVRDTMVEAGARLGIHSPVSVARVRVAWSVPKELRREAV